MSEKTLPEWPDEADFISIEPPDGHEAGREDYERARADAAMARLRVAVEALKAVCEQRPNEYYYVEVDDALSAIGELPPGEEK